MCLRVWSRSSCSYKCRYFLLVKICYLFCGILYYIYINVNVFCKRTFWMTYTIIFQQFINEARLYSYCNKKLMPLWLCYKVWPSITWNKAILHEILDTSLNSFRFMLYIGVKEWICIHKNCCHDESNDLREDKLICLLTEMEFHTF